MKWICADSVSLAGEAFADLACVKLLPETGIAPEVLQGADALITRSKTRLDRELLQGTGVRFVGTCTAGTDHMDEEGLRALGIHAVSAPGCNANAVSEYVLAAVLEGMVATGQSLQGKVVGVVGHGQVGSRVAAKLQACGCEVLLNDPPKAALGHTEPYVDLDTVVAEADILTLHVPLVTTGPWPTRHLLTAQHLQAMKPGSMLVNACRGEAVEGAALVEARRGERLSWLALDVWEPEPAIPVDLLSAADLATPHIAGHSLEGKVNGTVQIRQALCRFFDLDVPEWDFSPLLTPPSNPIVRLPANADDQERLRVAVQACYDIHRDDAGLRSGSMEGLPGRFTSLRRGYPVRREFSATRVIGLRSDESALYRALGFDVSDEKLST